MSGFQHAPVTKGMMMWLGAGSLAISMLDIKPYCHLQLSPHMTKYHQFWRILTHPFVFTNSTELLMGLLVLYNTSIWIERCFGPRKFASFVVVTSITSTLFSLLALIILHPFGLNYIPAGPYGVIFALLWQYHRIVPALYRVRVLGIEANDKWFVWVLASQLVLSDPPASLLTALSGILAGVWYRSDASLILPSSRSRRRLHIRPLRHYRIPSSLHLLSSRLFSPLLGASAPPLRSNRVLPGQVIVSNNATQSSSITTALRAMPAIRRTAVPAAAPSPAAAPEATSVLPAQTGEEEQRSAVGEWVDDLTGRGSRRVPSEEEIAAISSMFPNLGRDAVVQALQRSNYNTAMAVESLLEQGT